MSPVISYVDKTESDKKSISLLWCWFHYKNRDPNDEVSGLAATHKTVPSPHTQSEVPSLTTEK